MRFEIVARQSGGAAGPKIAQRAFDRRPVDRARMVEIDFRAARQRYAGTIAIKIIQRNTRDTLAERSLKFFCEPTFARATAADDCDEASLVPAVARRRMREILFVLIV